MCVCFLRICLLMFNLGLAISAFARGYQVLDEQEYLERALKAAQFVHEKLYVAASGRLRRSAYRENSG